jgi:site-specific DNA recombinase
MPPKGEHPAKGWAATYGRVSRVRTDIAQDSPENHERLNRQAALLHGLRIEPGFEFYDHGVSGSKDVRRPEFERAVKAVVDRQVETLIVPALDRLSRRGMRHVGEVLDNVEAAGGRIIFVKEALDTAQPTSRAIIAFLSEQARAESATTSWRIETWHEGCRLKGKWNGKRPYGYQVVDGKLAQDPEEAAVLRRIVADFLNGESCRGIAKALNADGIPSPGAAKAAEIREQGREARTPADSSWGMTAVRSLLYNPALVGWRQHKGKVVVGPDGEPVSFGDGIFTAGDRVRVLAELDRRTTVVHNGRSFGRIGGKTGGGRPARYLLTSIAICGSCGFSMVGYPRTDRSGGSYRCASVAHATRCPAPAYIKLDAADEEVVHQLTKRLAAMDPDDPILEAIAERWRQLEMPEGEDDRALLNARLESVRSRIIDLEEGRYVRGEFVTAEEITRWEAMMDRLRAQRDAVEEARRKLGPPAEFDLGILLDAYQSRERWEATPLEHRRELLKVAVDRVVIESAHGSKMLAADRIRVVLAGEEAEGVMPRRRRIDRRWAAR